MKRLLTTLIALTLFAAVAVGGGVSGLRLPWETTKKINELTAGLGTGTVTSLGEGVMMDFSANPITTTGTIAFDTAAFKLWWASGATAWDTFKIAAGWGILKTSSADTVTLTGDSATIHTWGNGFWLDDAYADTIQIARDTANAALAAAAKAQDTANAALARRDTLTAGWGIDLAAKPTGDDTVTIDSATVHTWGDAFWLDTLALDTTAFHDSSLTDTSKVLLARVGNFDTTAGPAALNVAGSAWVRDTVFDDYTFTTTETWVGRGYEPGNTGRLYVVADSAEPQLRALITNTSIMMSDSVAPGGHAGELRSVKMFVAATSAGLAIHHDSCLAQMDGGDGGGIDLKLYGSVSSPWADTTHIAAGNIPFGNDSAAIATTGNVWARGYAVFEDSVRSAKFEATGAAGFVGVGAVVPGQIIDWYGDSSAFPTGYVLCDGTRKFKNANGDSVVTPDLRNFFTVGASIDTGNGIPMSSIEDTTGAAAKATGGSVKYTPAGEVDSLIAHNLGVEVGPGSGGYSTDATSLEHAAQAFTGTRAVLVQPYVACWKLVRSRTW